MSGLYILSAELMRQEHGTTAINIMQGYRLAQNEDEARGSFVATVWKEKPGFSISQLLVMMIPDEHIIEAHNAIFSIGETNGQ